MANIDKAFTLISSLSRGEKLHFKRFAGKYVRANSNNYIKLFDAINQQSKKGSYDEDYIKILFRNESFIKHFPVMKSYLYENILKSLNSTQNNETSLMLNYSHILYSKGLYAQSLDMLKKARHTALLNEDFNLMLGIYELEYNLGIKFDINNQRKKLKVILKEEQLAVKKILNLNKYKYYLATLPAFNSKEILIRSGREKKRVKSFVRNTPMLAKDRSLSFRAKFLYLMVKGMTYYSLGNFLMAYKYFQQQLILIEKAPPLRKNIDNYALVLHNFMYMAFLLGKFKEVPALVEKFENLIKKQSPLLSVTSKSISLFFYHLAKLDLLIYTGDFKKYRIILSQAEEFENSSSVKHSDFSMLLFRLSTAYFAIGENEKALNVINKYFNEYQSENQVDVLLGAKILSIFIHYELRNIELLQYLVKSLYRMLLKRKKKYKFESLLIKFIRRLPGVKLEEDFIMNLRVLKKEMVSLRKDPFESRVFFEYFDYPAWIESKIECKPIAEILKTRGI